MNKNAIQKFAIWARNELIAQVSQRAYQYGIDESGFGDASADTLNGRLLTAEEKSQRQELIKQIKEKGYKQVMEEVSYTWFNRFIALRFMEVNNYLPSHIRVFSDASGAFKPEILNDVLHLDLPGLDSGKVAEYIESNDTEALYRYLLLTQCNALNSALPVMFERMGGYTEMLLPNNILRQDSVLGHMVSDIPEEDWQDAVQIIGWLYQYYNTELKDDTFAQLKKNVKITKERIPAATQLFTPDWIVRYMVENSLGRLWLEGHPNAELHDGWKYYLDEAEQEPEVEAQLAKLREEYKTIKPEEIKVIDPCMGSGHILVYAFDVLMQIYTSAGWDQREAAQSILKNNLYGLDIDDRAAQLAYFAVMMKARQYDRRLLTRGIQPHIYAFAESNTITTAPLHDMGITLSQDEYDTAVKQVLRLLDELRDAKEYGSILTVTPCDWDLLRRFAVPRTEDEGGQQLLGIHGEQIAAPLLQRLINIGEALSQQYDVVVTNPPYMGASGMNARLSQYIKDHFPDTKADLFACFIERGNQMAVKHGYNCMVTMQSWMFLSSFEKMREKILRTKSITNLMHMENMVMGIAFGTAVTIFRNDHITGYKGTYNQINLCELGPRSTGKSHIYKEISPNSILVSGGQTTVANLFYNMGRKTVGLVGLWDCVAFDEVAGINFKDKDGIQIMKDYMASGSFARGKEEKAATASMVFVGNINQSVDVLLKTSSLFDPFPPEMGTDTAFLDRMHCYIPGWEIPKFRPEHFTNDYGFITDYLAEFIRELRKEQYGDALDKYFRLGKNLNQRDTIAVRKMVGGMIKLLYPDGEFTKEQLEEILKFALEMRRRVKEQLKKLGGMEFHDINFSYIDNDTFEEHFVSVPEQGGGKLIPEGMCNPGQVYTVSQGKSGMIGVFRLESQMLPGSGKFERTGLNSDGKCKEAANTAFNYLKANGNRISGAISTTTKDYIINYQDLQGIGMTEKLALPTLIALCSIALGKPTLSSLAVLGEISIAGTMLKVDELANALQVCLDSGAKKVLLPITSAADLGLVPADLIGCFNLVFYQSAEDAVYKALGVE